MLSIVILNILLCLRSCKARIKFRFLTFLLPIKERLQRLYRDLHTTVPRLALHCSLIHRNKPLAFKRFEVLRHCIVTHFQSRADGRIFCNTGEGFSILYVHQICVERNFLGAQIEIKNSFWQRKKVTLRVGVEVILELFGCNRLGSVSLRRRSSLRS